MRLENILDGIHASVTHRWYLQVFTAFTRILLAVGFIPPSYTKIMHRPFTVLPDSNPVGHYFNALYHTGFYYEFLGWGQMIAAILLLFPRTAHLGALMFLPIIVNIAVLTASVGFKGTWVLTLLMSFAALWLVAWDYDRLKPILFSTRNQTTRRLPFQLISLPIVFSAGGALMAGIWAYIGLGNFSNYLTIAALLSGIGLVFGFVVALHLRFMKVGELQDGDGGNIL
ncbi:MAG: DoxX family protein [Pyrinomonadaceae bacterium]